MLLEGMATPVLAFNFYDVSSGSPESSRSFSIIPVGAILLVTIFFKIVFFAFFLQAFLSGSSFPKPILNFEIGF